MSRVILFAEVPCFYAMVERSRDPALAARPVIVGGDPRKRGLVQSATPDALAAGVVLDAPVLEALERCPNARAIRTNMRLYREVSRRLLASLRRVFERLERFGLGAAFFDVSGARQAPEAVAQALCDRVRKDLDLPLRAGIASAKFLAKLAAEEAGLEGVRQIRTGEEQGFLRPLEVTRLGGVGQRTRATLAELGVSAVGDLPRVGRERLEAALGNHGLRILDLALGRDPAAVRGTRHPQSLSRESTLEPVSAEPAALAERIQELARRLEETLQLEGLAAARVSLKLRYADLVTVTRSGAASPPVRSAAEIQARVQELLARTQAGSRRIRSVGITLQKLFSEDQSDPQLELFSHQS